MASRTDTEAVADVRALLEAVCDPEIPVLTIANLGVLRDVRVNGDAVEVVITPTYSGCPAMNAIEADIRNVLKKHGWTNVTVTTVLSPPWTTDWLSEAGREKLLAFGIAPPAETSASKRALFGAAPTVRCPKCRSERTTMVSQFGSTACKALYKCDDCLEPFDYFKCL